MTALIYKDFDTRQQEGVIDAVKDILTRACPPDKPVRVFFRADDIAVPSQKFDRMMHLFLKYRVPLCPAVVPVWLTHARWQAMKPYQDAGRDLFCWHMHGFRHKNHETEGKKQEFGPKRSRSDIFWDLTRGYDRLASILGRDLAAVFTPPWNRCSKETLSTLKALKFKGVSRSFGAAPPPPDGLKDMVVHVDLHTRKDKTPKEGLQSLVKEFETGIFSGACGIMIHHMCMDETAFDFLENLLVFVANEPQIQLVTYNDLV